MRERTRVVIPRVVVAVNTGTCYVRFRSRSPTDFYAAPINANRSSTRTSTSLGICGESEPTSGVVSLRPLGASVDAGV